MGIDTDKTRLRIRSLLKKAGLADVSPGVMTGVCVVALVLALVSLVHFWPEQNVSAQDFSLSSNADSLEEGQEKEEAVADDGADSSEQILITMKVDVEGEVNNPGLVTLDASARVDDAIKSAGGFTKKAARQSVNLAQELKDGDQVYVASKDAGSSSSSDSSSSGSRSSPTGTAAVTEKININTATAEELQEISGIGPSLSQRIVDYREANGSFASTEELKEVSGIGDTRYESMKDQICV